MRLRRLDLTRYGKFTGRSLDFGEATPGTADLHIVFGRNEAGKSTTQSAWLDLMFGIPARTGYAFLHDGPSMRIGAVVETGGRVLEVARVKRATATLLGPGGAPMPDSALLAALGVAGRDSYEAMFCLDDDSIEQGGDSILQGKGEVGELLFSAASGLGGLGQRLSDLRKASEGFHRPRAHQTGLTEVKVRLEEIDASRKQIDTQAGEYARLTEAEAQADAAHVAARAAAAQARADAAAARRRLDALPVQARLARCLAELAPLTGLVDAPDGWADRLALIRTRQTDTAARSQVLQDQAVVLAQQVAALRPDPAILAVQARLAALATQVSAHDEAVKDLPSRQIEAAGLSGQVADLLVRLDRGALDAQATRLPSATLAGLRRLIEARSGLDMRLATARREADLATLARREAETRLAATGAGLADAAANPETGAALDAMLAQLRAADPLARLERAGRDLSGLTARMAALLAALAPWRGTLADLQAQDPPEPPELDTWAETETAARQVLRDTATQRARLAQDRAQDRARLQGDLAARGAAPAVSLTDVTTARTLREALWAQHLHQLTRSSANAFEAALRADDDLAARRVAHSGDEGRSAELQAALARAATADQALQTAEAAAAADLNRLAAQLAVTCSALSCPMDTVAALRDWLAARRLALDMAANVAQAASESDLAAQGVAGAAAALAALIALPPATATPMPYPAVLALAQARSANAARTDAARAQLRVLCETETRRLQDLHSAAEADLVWQADWQRLAAESWLAKDTPPDPAISAERLTLLEELNRTLAAKEALDDRIAKMTANRNLFIHQLAGLADDLGLDPQGPDAAWPSLNARLRAAEGTAADASRLAAEQGATQVALAGLATTQAGLEGEIAGMCDVIGATSPGDLQDRLAGALRRVALRKERLGLETDLLDMLGQSDLASAMAGLDPTNRAGLDANHLRLTAEADQAALLAEQTLATLIEARRKCRAVGSDDQVARLDAARQTLLLQAAEAAETHLRQRLGLLALERGLRAYRDTHRSAMMTRAGAAFAELTAGAYQGLATEADKDREILIAVTAEGRAKRAETLSKGTRFQLYLALRIAAYHGLAETGRPAPFLADDIMETFDDTRAAAAFRLLHGMAALGQVIYLTHHQHLCDIAVATCPGVRLHRLDD